VEAELRTRDRELRELRDELHYMQACNDGLHREMRALKRLSPSNAVPEESTLIFSLKSVSLGRQTGGYDDDNCSGDEALQVVLEPHDVDNHLIKVPGTLEVWALEISPEGQKKPLCSWCVSPEQLRRTWRNGILSTGYFVVLPWRAWPGSEKLRVMIRFNLADSRSFEADKDVTVRLPALAQRKPLPAPDFPEALPFEQGPPPRQIDPPPSTTAIRPTASPAATPSGNTTARSLGSAVQILPPRPRK
jgi:hypothetical protein